MIDPIVRQISVARTYRAGDSGKYRALFNFAQSAGVYGGLAPSALFRLLTQAAFGGVGYSGFGSDGPENLLLTACGAANFMGYEDNGGPRAVTPNPQSFSVGRKALGECASYGGGRSKVFLFVPDRPAKGCVLTVRVSLTAHEAIPYEGIANEKVLNTEWSARCQPVFAGRKEDPESVVVIGEVG